MKIHALALILLAAVPARAFTLNSTANSDLKGWSGGDVQLLVNTANCPAGVDVVAIVKDAVEVWNNVPSSSVKVSYGGATTSTASGSPPVVYCETNFAAIPGGPDANYVPGAATVSAPGGQIVAGRIFLNATGGSANIANFDFNTNVITMAHEIGHLLGLGHSHTTIALMYFDGSYRSNLGLAQDDIDGISYLYPSDETKGGIYGCGTVQGGTPMGPSSALLILLLLALPLAAFARSRARLTRAAL